MSSTYLKNDGLENQASVSKPKLDIIVPVFDPGIPDDLERAKKDGVWPELRRAEANRFAYKMKIALEETGTFGAVRVTPDKSDTGDLYVIGKIEKSNGAEVGIEVQVFDISDKKWLSKSFDHTVPGGFYDNIRNKGRDPYDPVFAEAASYIAAKLSGADEEEVANLKRLTDIRFGASFSEDAFAQYLKVEKTFWGGRKVTLAGMPSSDDPMVRRVRAIRVRDQLFVDRMQSHYVEFSQKMEDSYAVWQSSSSLEVKAERAAKNKAFGQALVGVLLVAGAVAAANNNNNYNPGTTAGAVAAGVGGVALLSKSFKTSQEAKVHREALAELGQSLDIEMAPTVVAFEESTAELTGDASEQFNQWRAFLREIYVAEAVPDVQL
jgi:hypothetical protein